MKKLISLICVLFLIMSTLCGCSSKTNGFKIYELPSQFKMDYLMSPQDVLKEFEEIDLHAKMDIKDSYTKKVEVDDTTDTSIVYYYDGDTLVYTDYIGYGEDVFKLHLTDKDGSTKTISYTDDDDKRCSVFVSCPKYSVEAYNINKSLPYGAEAISISVSDTKSDSDNLINMGIEYNVDCKSKIIMPYSVTYKNDKGEYRVRYFYYGPDADEPYYDELLYSPLNGKLNIAGDEKLIKEIHNIPGTVEVVLKRNSAESYMYKIIDGVEHRYIESTMVVVFEDKKSRDDFAAKHPTDLDESYCWFTDDNEYYTWEGTAVLELLPELIEKGWFDSTADLVYTEYDTAIGVRVKIDQNGGITEDNSDALIRFD